MANKSNGLAHTKWLCKYHIVFTPKYRRKIFFNQYKESIRQLCQHGRIKRSNNKEVYPRAGETRHNEG